MIVPPHPTPLPVTPVSPPLRVLFAISEADPLVKVGGLGDVGGALPQALSKLGKERLGGRELDMRVVLPFHTPLKDSVKEAEFLTGFSLPVGRQELKAEVFRAYLGSIPVYLIDGKPVSNLPGVYGDDPQKLAEKFTFFSLAVLHLAQEQGWEIDVLHAHDWHSALCLYGIDTLFKSSRAFKNTNKVLSVHNLPYLGEQASRVVKKYHFPPSEDGSLPQWAKLLPLPLGLLAADRIVAVSPTYAREILTPEFGSGLEDFLRPKAGKITGILNGLDLELWNPETDGQIPKRFSVEDLEDRHLNKEALQQEFKLEKQPDVPLIAMIGRLDYQKGIDLAIKALTHMADLPWQAIFLGTGSAALEKACRDLEERYPEKVRAALRFDAALSRRLYAGADLLLMPSRYEPCGLAQMIAMRYGCIPLGRATGGLKDTISDAGAKGGTGFLFEEATASSLAGALSRALQRYSDKKAWTEMQKLGMQKDFSWEESSRKYAEVYLRSGGAG